MPCSYQKVHHNKKAYLDLLLLADEQEDMVDRYLFSSDMYIILDDDIVVGEFVVSDEGNGVVELKNLAIKPELQGRGYGRACITFIKEIYAPAFTTLIVGTGDSPLTLPFYQACGFEEFKRIPHFFLENYDHPIVEDGVMLDDMVYLAQDL